MCGIAGLQTVNGAPPEAHVLDGLTAAIAHRGPDGQGRFVAPGLGVVQTRLAIIDLATGDQPLFGPNETALVANGEIYNYIELRREFAVEKFNTQSDCEVPLHTYQRSGSAFASQLRGMYAVALTDPAKGTVELARDPFGIKPLYYAATPRGVVFASEPEAILRSKLVEREIRPEAASELLQLQFTTGRKTIFSGIDRVLPGETITLHGGKVLERRITTALPDAEPRDITEDEALLELERVLMDSVSVHQRSDVPYGMFLSGGVDSSALIACMARLNDRPVRAFTAWFPGTDAHDEREHASKVARAVGAEHIEVSVTENDFWKSLPAIVAAVDDPTADYAIVPTYLLAQEAAKELKVVLSGEGGDELFAGYGRYRTALRPRVLGGRKMRRRGVMHNMGILRGKDEHWRDGIAKAEKLADRRHWTRLQRMQFVDCADWLPNDLLLKLDRCLMAHGLEGRTPFLDPVVADMAFRLPDHLKISGETGKYLLRKWLEKALPEAQAFSKKRGFTVPIGEWIQNRAEKLAPLVARSEGIKQVCNPEEVLHVFRSFARAPDKREAMACWHLLFYALWHRVHGEGRQAEGSVMDILGTP